MDIETDNATQAIEEVLYRYLDAVGPQEPSGPVMLDGWVLVSSWREMDGDDSWTCTMHSGCSWPMRVGLHTIALNTDYQEPDDD